MVFQVDKELLKNIKLLSIKERDDITWNLKTEFSKLTKIYFKFFKTLPLSSLSLTPLPIPKATPLATSEKNSPFGLGT